MSTETVSYYEVRWQCRECRLFVADKSIESVDHWDPINTYYGFSTETTCYCKHCERRTDEPLCIPVRERTMEIDR